MTRLSIPPVFADLLVELNGRQARIDVEQAGWLKSYGATLQHADRVGLILRGKKRPSVWVSVNGTTPEYFSRVKGQVGMDGHQLGKPVRVAGLRCGDTQVWLHRDGLVEVGSESTCRGL